MPDGPVEWGRRCPTVAARLVGLGHRAPIAGSLPWSWPRSSPLAGSTAAVAAPAQPAPNAALAAKARRFQAKLDAQHAEVERLAERLNATEDNRDRLRVSLRRLQARQKAAQAELDTAQAQLDEQARATYMQGPSWLLGGWSAGPASPPDALRRLPMQRAALEARA